MKDEEIVTPVNGKPKMVSLNKKVLDSVSDGNSLDPDGLEPKKKPRAKKPLKKKVELSKIDEEDPKKVPLLKDERRSDSLLNQA